MPVDGTGVVPGIGVAKPAWVNKFLMGVKSLTGDL
jgi:hypothetical protein